MVNDIGGGSIRGRLERKRRSPTLSTALIPPRRDPVSGPGPESGTDRQDRGASRRAPENYHTRPTAVVEIDIDSPSAAT